MNIFNMVPLVFLYNEHNELLDHVLIGRPVRLPAHISKLQNDTVPLSALMTKCKPPVRSRPIRATNVEHSNLLDLRKALLNKRSKVDVLQSLQNYVVDIFPSQIIAPTIGVTSMLTKSMSMSTNVCGPEDIQKSAKLEKNELNKYASGSFLRALKSSRRVRVSELVSQINQISVPVHSFEH